MPLSTNGIDKDMKPDLKKLIIDIKIRDMDRAVNFYNNSLGLKLIHKDKDWASFEAMGAEIHLYLYGGATEGMEFRVQNLKKQVKLLKQKGIKFYVFPKDVNLIKIVGSIMHYPWGITAYIKDSEGNQIALVEDEQYDKS